MRRDEEDESWEAEAQASFAIEAQGEFERYKRSLMPKPATPYHKVINSATRLLERIKGICRRLFG